MVLRFRAQASLLSNRFNNRAPLVRRDMDSDPAEPYTAMGGKCSATRHTHQSLQVRVVIVVRGGGVIEGECRAERHIQAVERMVSHFVRLHINFRCQGLESEDLKREPHVFFVVMTFC
jgi:hypothetical protein